jgi:hypothetical protein
VIIYWKISINQILFAIFNFGLGGGVSFFQNIGGELKEVVLAAGERDEEEKEKVAGNGPWKRPGGRGFLLGLTGKISNMRRS